MKRSGIIHLIGFSCLVAGSAVASWVLWALAHSSVSGPYYSIVAMTRVWWWGIGLMIIGGPLFSARWRSVRFGHLVFDLTGGLLVTFLLLVGIDQLVGRFMTPGGSRYFVHQSQTLFWRDPHIGYTNRPDVVVETWLTQDDRTIHEAVYTTDGFGRRQSITNEQAENYLLFLGDSFTFGFLVNDEETLPAAVAEQAPAYQVYNYGANGYGSQQVLAMLESGTLPAEIEARTGIAVYTFIGAHVRRVVGTTEVIKNWGHLMVNYEVHGESIKRSGTLISDRPLIALLHGTLATCNLTRQFGIHWPRDFGEDAFEKTARIIAAARDEYVAQFGNDQFYVLIYPGHGDPRLNKYLDQYGVRYLDYTGLFTRAEDDYWLPEGHPSPAGYALVAAHLVDDLKLDRR